jgi:hypothetical protein
VQTISPFTSATASGVGVDVVYGSKAPPAPVDEVHEIDHSIDIDVWKW